MINQEDKLDEMMNLDESEQYRDEKYNEVIKKGIRNRIYKRSIIIFIIGSILIGTGYFSTSFILNKMNYNPFKENGIVLNEDKDDTTAFNLLMKHYISIYYPGISYYGYPSLDTSNGFSSYTIHATFADLFYGLNTGVDIKKMQISNSKLNINDINFSNTVAQFNNIEILGENTSVTLDKIFNKEEEEALIQEYISKISKMPDSSIVDLSLTFQKKMNINDFIIFTNEYKNSDFVYLLTNIINYDSYGLNENDRSYYEYSDEFNKKYPEIEYRKDRNAQQITERYLSLLSLMIDNKEFFDLASNAFTGYSESRYENLKEEYKKVKESGLELIGTRVYASKEDALNLLSSEYVEYVTINNAKFSEFEK